MQTATIHNTSIRNQARICDLLQWQPVVYSNHIYNTGLAYLEEYFSQERSAINELMPRAEFWNWWKNQFNIRNDAFINEWDGLESTITVHDLRKIYSDLHNPYVLACEIRPPKIVYGKNFTHHQLKA